MKKLWEKYKELILYVVFGVLTTAVGMGSYFIFLKLGALFVEETSAAFYAVRLISNVLQWVLAVLFAFFTNKKWVFEDEVSGKKNILRQLGVFAGSRVLTGVLDTVISMGGVWLLDICGYTTVTWENPIYDLNISADLIAKIAAAVVVIILNYVISKLLVFKNKKKEEGSDA